MIEEQKKYLYALTLIDNLGNYRIKKLLERFSNIEDIFSGSIEKLTQTDSIGKLTAEKIIYAAGKIDIDREYEILKNNNKRFITYLDEIYPDELKQIPDPPMFLFYKGNLELLKNEKIAIVGSRRCSIEGRKSAEHFAGKASEYNITVVSGMAAGIDAKAHQASIKGPGSTIAVLGGDVDNCYPSTNFNLYKEIVEKGLILSEYKKGEPIKKENFPRRNRIISGLSKGVLIVQSARRSGALITSNFAIEQNRDVYTIPGPIYDPLYEGNNVLIKQGAKLVTKIEDILEEFSLEYNRPLTKKIVLNKTEEMIYNIIKQDKKNLDELLELTNLDYANLSLNLFNLLDSGIIEEYPGNYYKVKDEYN